VLSLILDSLGSTELLFILVIALMFFGPRKLPQLSRTIGKSLAEFRKASEDFKRTWEREVALESARSDNEPNNTTYHDVDSFRDHSSQRQLDEPSISPIPAEHVMARGSGEDQPELHDSETIQTGTDETAKSEYLPKREWL
jgi:TatA/E family protein of Tat protein translocase